MGGGVGGWGGGMKWSCSSEQPEVGVLRVHALNMEVIMSKWRKINPIILFQKGQGCQISLKIFPSVLEIVRLLRFGETCDSLSHLAVVISVLSYF